MVTSSALLNDVFFCPEESNFYSQSLETLVLNQCVGSEVIIEFGSGDGSPVINSLLKTSFDGLVVGFELNALAAKAAKSKINNHNLNDKYIIHNCSFFDYSKPPAEYLIS